MSFPNRITKDTSARKGPAPLAPLAPHDAALQAYMHTFINSIHNNAALATHARHAEHEHDFQALKVCFVESYNDAVRKLNKKFADDLTALNAERDKKVAELRREFTNDPLGTIVKQQNVATGRNEQSHVPVEQGARTPLANGAAGEPRAASIKQEPPEEPMQVAPTPSVLQEGSVPAGAIEAANARRTPQLTEPPRELESTASAPKAQQQNGGCAEVGIAGDYQIEGAQACQDLVKVKSEVIQAGLDDRGVRADSVLAESDDQIQTSASLDDCPGADDATDTLASKVYVDLTE